MEAPVRTRYIWIRRIIAGILIISACLLCACSAQSRKELELRSEGIALIESGDYSEAISRFDEALNQRNGDKVTDTDIDILRYRAEAEWKIEDYAAASDTYRLLIEHDGARAEDKNMRVICIVRSKGNLEEALSLYNDTDINMNSVGHKEAMYELGNALTSATNGDDMNPSYTDAAMNIYTQALDTPDYVSAELYNRIGLIFYKQEKYEEALGEFSKGIAWADSKADKEDTANKAAIITSDSYKALKFNEASCYEYLTDYEKALGLFKAYEAEFGEEDKSTHEIEFLETR